jgi:hypothetical protein
MDIDQSYQKIIQGLELGARSLTRFNRDELNELRDRLKVELEKKNSPELEKLLCLIDHSSVDDPQFEPLIIEALNQDLPPRLLVFALNCSRKHVIQARFKKGHRLEFDFLETLKKLLFSPSPEVVEWTLRTIEECGNQGIYFLKEFDKIKPPFWKWFNAHQRAVLEIITMLERRWSRFEKPGT